MIPHPSGWGIRERRIDLDNRFVKVSSEGVMNVSEIWVDTETGVNYFFHVAGYAGGLTPLLNRDGKPIVSTLPVTEEGRR